MEIRKTDNQLEGFKWIVTNEDIFAGKPIIKGTRFSVSFVLNCLAQGMTGQEIEKDYPGFPVDCISNVLSFAAKLADAEVGDNMAA